MKISKCRTNFIHVTKSNLAWKNKFGGLDPPAPMFHRPNQGLGHVLGFMRSRPMVVASESEDNECSSLNLDHSSPNWVEMEAGTTRSGLVVRFVHTGRVTWVEGDLVLSPSFPCSLLSPFPRFLIGQCPFLSQPLPYMWHLTIYGEI
ncbi:hypothetical protein D8674_014390 [Pyrus ussuriensis x Pyrus communis]|uniref:Uncharacterized protein n=1 Tax=Pyrus ussuriensis x Pyrus communis TaxID=2448454 RepID=A0A5N5GX98_9ROSA|nr:hypothetical protein D8674_014390 [Pyrus ussuriensis x Pyrus communis]